jgi:sigma-B regulation protein RsbU (phosphoserine phosphatase)
MKIRDLAALLLEIYELAFSFSGKEIFNKIAEKIACFTGAGAVSLWIRHPKVADAETRLGYYQETAAKNLGALDYQAMNRALPLGTTNTGEMKGEDGQQWYYFCQPFRGTDTNGCCIIWSNEVILPDRFQQLTWEKAGQKIAMVIDHLLFCDRFDCQRIVKELNMAEKIQQNLIPARAPQIPGISIGFRSIMANQVGGDYLDLLSINNNRLGIVIGDAMGKGIPGAFVMVMTRAIFRLLARASVGPEVLVRQLNVCISPELELQNMFISFFYGIFDPDKMIFSYAIAGHNPPVVFRRMTREIETLPGKGLIIGGKSTADYQSFSVDLYKGDILVIYSDGLKEAKNIDKQQFGVDGIGQTIRNYAEYDARGISDCLAQTLMRYCNNQPGDDVSFVVLKVE